MKMSPLAAMAAPAEKADRNSIIVHGGLWSRDIVETAWLLLHEHGPDAERLLRSTMGLGPIVAAQAIDAARHWDGTTN